MFCQHTEPAVYYYTCRVSSSCDDLKLGEYTTTQDTFRILLNNIYKTKTHPIFPLILVLERKTPRCLFLGGIHWQALPRV